MTCKPPNQPDTPHPDPGAACRKTCDPCPGRENTCRFCGGYRPQTPPPRPQPRELDECPVCGGIVTQEHHPHTGTCELCGKTYESYYRCEDGCHFCDHCYGTSCLAKLGAIFSTTSKNPIEILNIMMKTENFGLRGCIHCAAAPLAIIIAFRNTVHLSRISAAILLDLFKLELSRIPLSLCKRNGTCAIAVACGNIFAKILLLIDRKYLEDSSVGRQLKIECRHVIDGLCSENTCCKKIAYAEIIQMTNFINRYLWIELKMPRIVKCEFAEDNPCCENEQCEFYHGHQIKQRGDLNY